MYLCFQNRISTYDFPVFCENEKSIHPTTHTCISSHLKPDISQAISYGELSKGINRPYSGNSSVGTKRADNRMKIFPKNLIDVNTQFKEDCKITIPLSKSISLKSFSDENHQIPRNEFFIKHINSQELRANNLQGSNKDQYNAVSIDDKEVNNRPTQFNPNIPVSILSKGSTAEHNWCNKNDSDSSSGSDLVDLITKKNVPVSEMYNDDIDYMNNYLKNLPDYNELNRKISNEQQKCEDIYDRLLCINSSLKSNQLSKSNSYHSISTESTKPHHNLSAQSGTKAKNKIIRSSSSSTVNHGFIKTPDKFGIFPIKPLNSTQIKYSDQKKSQAVVNDMHRFQPLPKSFSGSNLQRSNSKKGFNDFWSENVAKNNQQKLGWNYNKIMANKLENPNKNNEFSTPECNISLMNGYKLKKNLSLNQLGQKIQENVSREELYNMICNNDLAQLPNTIRNEEDSWCKSVKYSKPSHNTDVLHKPQLMRETNTSELRNVLSKSFSQTSMPSVFSHFNKVRSPKKNTIPTILEPLYKSISNTHAFNRKCESTQETYSPKLISKSSSSSSILNQSSTKFDVNSKSLNIDNRKRNFVCSNFIRPIQSKVIENNELLKAQKHISFVDGAFPNKQIGEKMFNKKLHTQLATNNCFKSKPNLQMPTVSFDTKTSPNICVDLASNIPSNRR